jgi:hypothetical protein
MENQLENGFAKVTAETCASIIKKAREKEDCFWKEDLKSDEQS